MGTRKLASRETAGGADAGRGVPTAETVLGFIRDAGRAIDVAAIAAHFGLKPKQVAAQVDALRSSGLVVKYPPGSSPEGRGKPRYAAAMEDAETPETQDAYLGLAELLLGVLVGGGDPDEVGRTAGRLIGKAVMKSDSTEPHDAVAQFGRFLESRGFRPKQVGRRPDVGFVLGSCPFGNAALTHPSLVCGLHRALAEGMAEVLGGLEVTDLVARDPRLAGCRLELHTSATDPMDDGSAGGRR